MRDPYLDKIAAELASLRNQVGELNRRPQHAAPERAINQFGAYVARLLALPSLRGLWLMAATDASIGILDNSGNGMTLANTNASLGLHNNRIPYRTMNGTTSRLSRAGGNAAPLNITGGLTLGAWVRLNGVTANGLAVGKWNLIGNQRSYALGVVSGTPDTWRFFVTPDGTSGAAVSVTGAEPVPGAWTLALARYTPSVELSIHVNGVKATNTTGIPAAIFNSSGDFEIGGGTAFGFLDGDIAMAFVCAAGASFPDELAAELYEYGAPLFQ